MLPIAPAPFSLYNYFIPLFYTKNASCTMTAKPSKQGPAIVKKSLKSKKSTINYKLPRMSDVPVPHRKFQQYYAVKQSSKMSYELNKSNFLDYCEQIVESGGIITLQKLIKDAINHNYTEYPSIEFINGDADDKVSLVKVVQEDEVDNHQQSSQLSKQEKNYEHTNVKTSIELTTNKNKSIDGVNNVSNPNAFGGDDSSYEQIEKDKNNSSSSVSKEQPTTSLPSIGQIKARIDMYVLRGDAKFLLFNNLLTSDMESLESLYSTSYERARLYYIDRTNLAVENNVVTHVMIYAALYNFHLVQYVMQCRRKKHEWVEVSNYRLRREYLKGPISEYQAINSASSGAFCMIHSFFLVPVVVPEFRSIFHFFETSVLSGRINQKRTFSVRWLPLYIKRSLSYTTLLCLR
ncbi:unnamed protein product [Mucor hiemalis]